MTVAAALLDLDFLDKQTFGDVALAREVLLLFQAQQRRILPHLAALPYERQTDAVHLLTGSCQGIGARLAVALLQGFEAATPAERTRRLPALIETFHALDGAIAAYLGAP